MEVLENRGAWSERHRSRWLAHFRATGEADWKAYEYVRNAEPVPGPAVEPGGARVLLVTSSGAYLRGEQAPFDAANVLGDPSHRLFPASTPLDRLAFAHDHYDHRYVDRDAQSAVPLRHLEAMVAEGRVGAVAPTVFSFSGYLPDAAAVVDEVAPPLLALARREGASAALLVPV